MKKKITVIKGDGIGPEIINQALKVLNCIGDIYNHSFEYDYALLGGECIEKTGLPITEDTITKAKSSDAVLLGSVGGPKWDLLPTNLRPEKGLLTIRKELNLFANLRPALL
ncbi:MAG: 3-isopropylmalate dehydrogenase, partial [Oscillospiraceae bacterium]|nr:3-isopropylmalate dehydrogenase [Oscillospiraceae bacterium]